jgi:hypothetical protein
MPSLKSALLPHIILRLWNKKLEALKLQVAMNRLFSFGPMRGRQLRQIKNKWVQINIAEAIKQTWDLFQFPALVQIDFCSREKAPGVYDIDRSPKDFYIFRFLCILYRLSYAQYKHTHRQVQGFQPCESARGDSRKLRNSSEKWTGKKRKRRKDLMVYNKRDWLLLGCYLVYYIVYCIRYQPKQ